MPILCIIGVELSAAFTTTELYSMPTSLEEIAKNINHDFLRTYYGLVWCYTNLLDIGYMPAPNRFKWLRKGQHFPLIDIKHQWLALIETRNFKMECFGTDMHSLLMARSVNRLVYLTDKHTVCRYIWWTSSLSVAHHLFMILTRMWMLPYSRVMAHRWKRI